MPKTVKVVTTDPDHPVRWPHYCTQCEAKDGLVSVSTQVVDVKTVKPWMLLLGQHHTELHTLKVGYPVCQAHAHGLSIAPFAAAGFVWHAFRKIPLRLVRLEDDAVTIRFKANRYARAFQRTNHDIMV